MQPHLRLVGEYFFRCFPVEHNFENAIRKLKIGVDENLKQVFVYLLHFITFALNRFLKFPFLEIKFSQELFCNKRRSD